MEVREGITKTGQKVARTATGFVILLPLTDTWKKVSVFCGVLFEEITSVTFGHGGPVFDSSF